ncbi:MAG TPA: hypothetical protein VGL44_08020, partial [Gaiellales bacterium]
FFGVVSRMRTDLNIPGDDRAEMYPVIAATLRQAIATYRDEILPAVSEERRLGDARKRITGLGFSWLLMSNRAMAELARAAAAEDTPDADASAITALRFIAQDIAMLRFMPPDGYHMLPLLSAEEFGEMEAVGSEIQGWIAAHAPCGAT